MTEKMEEASKRHAKGYNCSQAVACTFCEEANVNEKDMFRLMEGYGSGMGSLEGTCGAITGAVAILGAIKSTVNLEKPNSKGITYKYSKQVMQKFKEKNGAIVCKELKGIETGEVLRPCRGCVQDATQIVEEILKSEEE